MNGPNPQETADLVTFTEEILNGKLHFLCSDASEIPAFCSFDTYFSTMIFKFLQSQMNDS